MKNFIKHTIIKVLLVALVTPTGCKPEPQGELGEPFDKVAGMLGTWQLNTFIQTDLNNPIKEQRDLTYFFDDGIVTPMQITFNEDRSYYSSLEIGRNYFGEQGVWGFDDDNHPSYIILETTLSDGTPSDTLQYELGSVIRPFDNAMTIEYDRLCGEGPTASNTVLYSINFNRIN
ncbi:MAG: DUF5004 domain-containing protein [Flavobacteriales bacterium]|jgi:hypothetical protein|nr:DUF5004 domain-containing protein [Flavobacteriales bacterium]MBT6175458.1 DUF5004 domain-containing protein [Flavobacteriales bacterium]